MKKWIFLLAMMTAMISQAGDLLISPGVSMTYALPVPARSCVGDQLGTSPGVYLAAATFDFSKISFQWTGEDKLEIKYIELEFVNPKISGGHFAYTIGGDELFAVLGDRLEISGGDPTIYKSVCGIRGGGLHFLNDAAPAKLEGTLKVFGIEINAQGNAKPVTGLAKIELHYMGKP